MARMPFLILFASIATSGLSGCGSATGPSSQDVLYGTWAWVESTGGIASVTLTPASTGDSMTLRFTVSDEAELFRNGSLVRTVGFVTTPGPRGAFEIRYDEPLMGFESQMATLPTSHDLTLMDPCCDGFVSRWVRAP
jgi:hypothetical protein